jgi:glycosyltransferase involved in cell wall biosynthesis
MKILEINKFHFPKGGADKHFLDVCELLESDGHEVARFCMEHENNLPTKWSEYFVSKVGYTSEYGLKEKMKGTKRMFYSREAHGKIKQLLDAFEPDVAHVHNIYHQLDPTILFEIKKRGIPIVMTVHDYKLINPNHALMLDGKPYEGCRNRKYYQCFLDKCVKNSYAKSFLAMLEMYWHGLLGTYRKNIDLFIAPSKYVEKTLIKWGIGQDKISVVPHFVPDIYTTEDQDEIASVSERKTALYAGRISEEKGVGTLLNIFRKNSDMTLKLAGSCENGFKITERNGLEYLGFLGKEEISKHMKESDIIVSASELPETFGLIALEAIMQGKPFFGMNTGALGEIIVNGENGFLANNASELEQAIKYYSHGLFVFDNVKIRKNAQEKFGAEIYKKRVFGIFNKLI